MRHGIPLLILGLGLLSCAAAPGAVSGAVINTAAAATASAISRANGGCYASCPPGTRCDPKEGLCEPIPCRDLCSTDEVCEVNAISERCVPKVAGALLNFGGPPRPAAAPTDPR